MGANTKHGEGITQINMGVNKEQAISEKRIPLNRDGEDKSKDSAGYIGTRYGGIIRKQTGLHIKNATCYIHTLHIVGSSLYKSIYFLI